MTFRKTRRGVISDYVCTENVPRQKADKILKKKNPVTCASCVCLHADGILSNFNQEMPEKFVLSESIITSVVHCRVQVHCKCAVGSTGARVTKYGKFVLKKKKRFFKFSFEIPNRDHLTTAKPQLVSRIFSVCFHCYYEIPKTHHRIQNNVDTSERE